MKATIKYVKEYTRKGDLQSYWGFVCPVCSSENRSRTDVHVYGGFCNHCDVTYFIDSEEYRGYSITTDHYEPVVKEPLIKCPYCDNFMPYKPTYQEIDGTFVCEHCRIPIFDVNDY